MARYAARTFVCFFEPGWLFGGKNGAAALALMSALLLAGCAGPSNYHRGAAAPQRVVIDASKRGDMVMTALSLLDTRYRYGGENPAEGFDCSGLVAYVVDRIADERLPHNAAVIAQTTRPINRKNLKAGDLVFFNTLNQPYSHVGIYVGDGLFVNAPSSGGRVRLDALDSRYFARRFEGAGTFFTE